MIYLLGLGLFAFIVGWFLFCAWLIDKIDK